MTFSPEVIADGKWAAELASRFKTKLHPSMRLCLATGKTTAPFYAEVAERAALDGLTIFLLDEFGGLAEDDPGRCMAMIKRDLLDLARGHPTVHVPDVDASDPEHEADRYGDQIEDGSLDLAIVGLGGNGHVGMNEPGATADLATRVVSLEPSTTANAAKYGATTLPTWGITVGLSELMEADEVWVLVTGEHKRDILNRTIQGPVGSGVPATFLTEHPNCSFFVDESATLTE